MKVYAVFYRMELNVYPSFKAILDEYPGIISQATLNRHKGNYKDEGRGLFIKHIELGKKKPRGKAGSFT